MVYNKADFKKHIETLQIEGFKIKSAVQAFLFIRKQNNKTETITISYRDYAPHGYYIDGVSADIYFEEVESILEKVYESQKVKSRYGKTGTIHKSLVNLPRVDYSVFETEIKDEVSFQKVSAQVEKLVKEGALPFFEQFNSLQKVFDCMENISIEDMSNFIGQPLPQRRMIIKKLCKDPYYEDYAQMVIKFYANENDPDEPVIKELDSVLKSR